MAEDFDNLKEQLPAEARNRVEQRKRQLLAELPLQELRRAREHTQDQLGRTLGVEQSSISKMERRTDMYLSTLRSYVQAMGGELEIRARFPEGSYRVTRLGDLDEDGNESSGTESTGKRGKARSAPS